MNPANVQGASKFAPLRILMVTARFLPETGGIETHVYQVATRLAALGHDVTVLTTDRSASERSVEMLKDVRVIRTPAWPRKRDYYFAPGVNSEVRNGDWDVVHIQGCHTLVPVLAMAAAISGGKKFIVTFHSGGHSSAWRNRIRRAQWALLSPLFRRASHLVGVSRFEASSFSRSMSIAPQRFSVVYNGAEMPKVARPTGERRKLIASVGRLEKYKGHHRIIRAMPNLLRRDPDLFLRIVGQGPYKQELQALVERLGLSHHVEIAGVPPGERQEMADILSKSALVVLLSEYEAHPIAVMEALACGAKVLVTNISGLRDLVEDGLATAVESDASDAVVADAVWNELQNDSDGRAVQLPTWETCVESLESIYLSVVKGQGEAEGVPAKSGAREDIVSTAQVGS